MNQRANPRSALWKTLVAASALAFSTLVFLPSASAAGTYVNQTKLSATDGDAEDYLGYAVTASGNALAAGVPYDWDGINFGPGAVYVFEHAGFVWAQSQKLVPADGASEDEFGLALSMDGNFLAVGAPGHALRRGAVYLFERQAGTWVPIQKLLASDGVANNAFGSAVVFEGDRLVVGAPAVSSSRGAAYVFNRVGSSWVQAQRITAPDAAPGDAFGAGLALSGNRLAIGARLDDIAGASDNRGSVWIYTDAAGAFANPVKLVLADGRNSDQFGSAVALQGEHLLVGAPFRDRGAGEDNSGAAFHYQFVAGTWTLQSTLLDPLATASAGLGSSIALRGSTAVIGAPFGNSTTGFALHFELESGGWTERDRFVASDARPFEYFGKAVAISEEHAVVSAELGDVGGNVEQGSIYTHLRARTTASIATINPSPSLVGQGFVVNVAVSSNLSTPPGSVQVSSSDGAACTATLSNGEGSCGLPGHALGIKTIEARYAGDVGLDASQASSTHQVEPDLRITTGSLPKGKIGRAYSSMLALNVGGATLPINFSLAAGTLPSGFSINAAGEISGSTLDAGTYAFEVRATDSSPTAQGGPFQTSRALQLEIDPAFSTTLQLEQASTASDRGVDVEVRAQFDVVEAEAGPPSGTYIVLAQNGSHQLGCSAPVSAEGLQSCTLAFGFSDPQGIYTVSARFQPNQADYGSSNDTSTHTLFRAVDPNLSLIADRNLYRPGEFITYTLTAANSGPDGALSVSLATTLASGLTEVSWTCTGTACASGSGLGPIAQSLDIPMGASAVYSLRGRAGSASTADLVTQAQLSLAPNTFQRELDPGNNAASHTAQALGLFSDGFE